MGYFQVRYDPRVVIYDRRGFVRLTTDGAPTFTDILLSGQILGPGAGFTDKILDRH